VRHTRTVRRGLIGFAAGVWLPGGCMSVAPEPPDNDIRYQDASPDPPDANDTANTQAYESAAPDAGSKTTSSGAVVTFPQDSDTLVVLGEPDTPGSVEFKGCAARGDRSALLTELALATGPGPVSAVLDDRQRPTRIALGSRQIEASYSAEGTLSYQVRQGDTLVLAAGPDRAGMTPPRTARGRGSPPAAEVSSTGTTDLEACGANLAEQIVIDTLQARGFSTYHGSRAASHPLAGCLAGDEAWQVQLQTLCCARRLSRQIQTDLMSACLADQPGEFCTTLETQMTRAVDGVITLLETATTDLAARLWDDPACGCGHADDCPPGMLCDAGQCVPRCRVAADCPSDLPLCQADGACLAVQDLPEAEPEPEPEPAPDPGDGDRPLAGVEALTGCWRVTVGHSGIDTESYRLEAFILEIDEQGRLARLWAENTPTDGEGGDPLTMEYVRFHEDNVGVLGSQISNPQESVSSSEETADFTLSFEAEEGRRLINLEIGQAALSGVPPTEFVSETVDGAVVVDGETEGAFCAPAEGVWTTCPGPGDGGVLTQDDLDESLIDPESCGSGTALFLPLAVTGLLALRFGRPRRGP